MQLWLGRNEFVAKPFVLQPLLQIVILRLWNLLHGPFAQLWPLLISAQIALVLPQPQRNELLGWP